MPFSSRNWVARERVGVILSGQSEQRFGSTLESERLTEVEKELDP